MLTPKAWFRSVFWWQEVRVIDFRDCCDCVRALQLMSKLDGLLHFSEICFSKNIFLSILCIGNTLKQWFSRLCDCIRALQLMSNEPSRTIFCRAEERLVPWPRNPSLVLCSPPRVEMYQNILFLVMHWDLPFPPSHGVCAGFGELHWCLPFPLSHGV